MPTDRETHLLEIIAELTAERDDLRARAVSGEIVLSPRAELLRVQLAGLKAGEAVTQSKFKGELKEIAHPTFAKLVREVAGLGVIKRNKTRWIKV